MRNASVHTVICALCLGVIASCSSSWTDACTVTGPDGVQWHTMTVERWLLSNRHSTDEEPRAAAVTKSVTRNMAWGKK
ncbi:MAG: hypothetical protein IJR77_05040 [Bacteroidales bacterium]|nr:hypothetical protein [Bacteroidales bacterium]